MYVKGQQLIQHQPYLNSQDFSLLIDHQQLTDAQVIFAIELVGFLYWYIKIIPHAAGQNFFCQTNNLFI